MINTGTKVKMVRDLTLYGYSVKKGEIFKVFAADYETDFTLYELRKAGQSHPEIWVHEQDFEVLDETDFQALEFEIINTIKKYDFGKTDGYGRKIRIRHMNETGFVIEGGFLGAKFTVENGLVVWNIGSRNRMQDIPVESLYKMNEEFKKILEKVKT